MKTLMPFGRSISWRRGARTPPPPGDKRFAVHAFTLLELLVVLGLMAGLSVVLVMGLDGGRAAAVSSSQALLANLVRTARAHGLANEGARLLVNVDPLADSHGGEPKYLRMLALQVKQSGAWLPEPTLVIFLPTGAYLLPGNFSAIPDGLFPMDAPSTWVRTDGTPLRSTALRSNQVETLALGSLMLEQWAVIAFTGTGTTAQAGDLVIASGRARSARTYAVGESPVELDNPEHVRGMALSTYGLPVLINDRQSF